MRPSQTIMAAILLAVSLMPVATEALAKPYYFISASENVDVVIYVDAATIASSGDEAYRFEMMRVFNGDKLKSGAKSQVATLTMDCRAATYAATDFEGFDVAGKSIYNQSAPSDPVPVPPNSHIEAVHEFICAKDRTKLTMGQYRLQDHIDPIEGADAAYQSFTNSRP